MYPESDPNIEPQKNSPTSGFPGAGFPGGVPRGAHTLQKVGITNSDIQEHFRKIRIDSLVIAVLLA